MVYQSNNDLETEEIAARIARAFAPPRVFCLLGELGAGKTAFTRGMAKGYGYTGRVSSPTFTIMHQYDGDVPVYHFDLYRLEDEDELYDIGFEEYINGHGVCVVEWADKFPGLWEGAVQIRLVKTGENSRTIEVLESGVEH